MIGWKACQHKVLLKIEVPKDEIYLVCSAETGWYRATAIKVLEVIGGEEGISIHDPTVKYRKDDIVRCDYWTGALVGCCHGIHFFTNREIAERYAGIKAGHYGEVVLE